MADFREISIRGRFSYSLKCLADFMDHFSVKNELTDVILEQYALFTNVPDLGNWHERCNEYSPEFYSRYRQNDALECKYIPMQTATAINHYFKHIPKDLYDLYQLTFDIGIEHLYSRVSGDETIRSLEQVFEIMERNQVKLPDFEMIEFTSINDCRGWGKEFVWKNIWI